MSSSRVIQDSDDEDDPLAGPISPRPRVDNTDLDIRVGSGHHQAHQTGHDSHININFDQFLQSQESAHYGISSSQQRREARWIPADAGGGSIGSMMTEIGIAQQRLFDDDEAHYTEQSGYQYSGDMDTAQTESAAVQKQIAAEFPPHDDIALVPNEHPHGYSEQPPLYTEAQPDISDTLPYGTGQHPLDAANLYTHQPTAQPNDHTSFNYSVTTGASYNMFESSLRPSGSFDPETNIPTHATGTVDTEIAYKSPRRSDSVPPVPFSPHDTEPFSSVVSPKASRSKSDNAVQQSHQSVDELNGPVTIEFPVAEKKQRGRKKKQSIPEHDEDDELAQIHTPTIIQDATTTTTTTTNNKPEKRKPGRPPKNPKPPRNEDDDQPGLISNDTTAFPIPPETTTTSTDPLTTTEHQTTTTTTDPPPQKKQAKEPKKKKLKRGKTTSITLTKTYESDVEDDIIWVDERPVSTTTTPQTEAETQHPGNIPEHEETAPTIQNPDPEPEPEPQPAPAPKKRGRKRKNPVEEQSPAPAPAPAIDPQQSSDKEDNPVPDPNLTPHDDAKPQQEPDQQQRQEKEAEKENEDKSEPQQEQISTPSTPLKPSKGPTKHSPISSTTKVPYRVGLSRRARIAPLLKIVRR